MEPFFHRQLTQIKVNEMLQEAEDARADRKARMAHRSPIARGFRVALAAAPVVFWAIWAFILH